MLTAETCPNTRDFLTAMQTAVDQKRKEENSIWLCYYRWHQAPTQKQLEPQDDDSIFPFLKQYSIYHGPKETLETLKARYIDTFFHPEKEKLWNYLLKIHQDPNWFSMVGQNPQANLLLYGPPGSIYVLRLCFTREISLLLGLLLLGLPPKKSLVRFRNWKEQLCISSFPSLK
jgi:hypothetical protein